MDPGVRRRIGFAAAGGLAVLVLAGLLGGSDLLLDVFAKVVDRGERGVAGRLRRAGVLAYFDFDDVRPRDQVGRTGVVNGGTRLVAGRNGSARAFPHGEHGVIRTALPLPDLGPRFTVACWLRFPEEVPNQQIFQYLAVRDGNLVLQLNRQETLAWPITIRGRFFHAAFTVDPDAGRAAFYIDGSPVGDIRLRPLSHPAEDLCLGQARWTPPPSFTVDELAAWDRSLAPHEVRRLSRLRWSLALDTVPIPAVGLWLLRAARDSYRALLVAADLFDPSVHESRIYAAGLPSYALALSRDDVREFNKYFNEQVENGLNAPGTSKKRTVELLESGRRRRATMELVAGDYAGPEVSAKRTVRLEMLAEDEPERTVFIRPTEGAPYLVEVLAGKLARSCGVPVTPTELCLVSINGAFEGLSLCSDISRDQGLFWISAPGQAQALLRRLPVFRDEALREFDRLAAGWEGALRSDRKGPLSSREALHGLREQRRQLESTLADRTARSDEALVARVAGHVREDLFLGDNPHASLVVGDLDLSARRINGAELSFASLTPAILADDGRVSPPEGRAAQAGLRVSIRSGGASRTKDLSFAVLPRQRRIPILRVQSAGDPPARVTVPSLAEFIEGDNRRSGPLVGEIRLRGNTSLRQERNQKKYYRIELARPSDVPGLGRTRRLLLISGWKDKTLMRDRLSYDLFRSFSEPGKPRYSPHARLVELVLNGDYRGIYNVVDRVDSDLLNLGTSSGGADRPVLYKGVDSTASFKTPNRDAYVQKIPSWRDGEYWGPYERLITFIGSSQPETFRREIERLIDVDNVIDFEILLALTSNAEGINSNLYLARGGEPDARFFIVPWDYDISFNIPSIPSNYLIARLHRDLPDYNRRVAERWRALRRDRLSEASLMERIDGLVAEMAEGVERNFRRWPPTEGETWEGEVPKLRAFVRGRLQLLDTWFAWPPAHPAGTPERREGS
jgi:hypothetical protein